MTSTAQLTASRDTDKLVAEALGWREVQPPAQNGPVDLVGIPPGGEKPVPVPFYSSSTAAMLALEEWQGRTHNLVQIDAVPDCHDGKWCARSSLDIAECFEAPTLWLALCKLIVSVSTTGKENI